MGKLRKESRWLIDARINLSKYLANHAADHWVLKAVASVRPWEMEVDGI